MLENYIVTKFIINIKWCDLKCKINLTFFGKHGLKRKQQHRDEKSDFPYKTIFTTYTKRKTPNRIL